MTLLLLFGSSGGGGGVTQTVTLQASAGLTGYSIVLKSPLGVQLGIEAASELSAGVYGADFSDIAAGFAFVQFVKTSDSSIEAFGNVTLTENTATFPVSGGSASGGGGGDWTNTEKAQIRYQLGIDGTATAPTAPVTDPVVITPSGTGKTTLYALCVDRRGAAKSGVVVHCWLAGTRPAGSGIIADNLVETFTSGVNGVVQIPDRMLGFSYAVSVNSAENPVIVRISPNAGGTTAIPDLIS